MDLFCPFNKLCGCELLASSAKRAPPPTNVVFWHLLKFAVFGADNCYDRKVVLILDLRIVITIPMDPLGFLDELFCCQTPIESAFLGRAAITSTSCMVVFRRQLEELTMRGADYPNSSLLVYVL